MVFLGVSGTIEIYQHGSLVGAPSKGFTRGSDGYRVAVATVHANDELAIQALHRIWSQAAMVVVVVVGGSVRPG